jgi:beta-glucosidase
MTDKSEFAELLLQGADIVVMVLGEHGLQSGEGRSRVDIGLPGVQQNY